MIFLQHSAMDPAFNLALEETLLRENSEEFFLLWRNSPAVIVGRNQVVENEVDLKLAAARKIPVMRRITGGGAVYHDPGVVNFSFIAGETSKSPLPELFPGILSQWRADLTRSGDNDFSVSGKKMIGTAQCAIGGRRLFHGSILFDADLELLGGILTPPPEKPARHGVASVRARVGNLNAFLNRPVTVTGFLRLLEVDCCVAGRMECRELSRELNNQALILADRKYRSAAWNIENREEYDS